MSGVTPQFKHASEHVQWQRCERLSLLGWGRSVLLVPYKAIPPCTIVRQHWTWLLWWHSPVQCAMWEEGEKMDGWRSERSGFHAKVSTLQLFLFEVFFFLLNRQNKRWFRFWSFQSDEDRNMTRAAANQSGCLLSSQTSLQTSTAPS